MNFIPYSCQNITAADIAAVTEVLKSEYLTQGPVIGRFEQAFARRHQLPHAVAVSSATAALHIACLALGIGAGDRVWTSSNSFLASANCALYCGASVDFVDIDGATRNLSVAALAAKLESAAKTGTLPRLVIPVDFAGLPCDWREIRALADSYGFMVLADASHATGASYLGRPVGGEYAHATVFSFHAVKVITTAEGGMVTTHDAALAQRLRLLRSHGITRNSSEMTRSLAEPWYYEQVCLGFNYRMTDLQAALGCSQLERLDTLRAQRATLADRYDQLLSHLPLILPARRDDRESSWHLYVVEVDGAGTARSRAEVFAALRSAAIGVNVHYYPIHLQPYHARRGFAAGNFPATERYYSRAITLPLFPAMTLAQQEFVVRTLAQALRA